MGVSQIFIERFFKQLFAMILQAELIYFIALMEFLQKLCNFTRAHLQHLVIIKLIEQQRAHDCCADISVRGKRAAD